ncbi:hypothetical protein AMTR_s00142p00051930 [Amborella trichopoda]|uniref:Uncharacterized protein n=1 Tax=Amborella trichopoda TaxID=13333 RepID=W1PEA6_AMBTC|nr:hypothetical protein AMTR_s00142p00051930 [Amborella trichopoda]
MQILLYYKHRPATPANKSRVALWAYYRGGGLRGVGGSGARNKTRHSHLSSIWKKRTTMMTTPTTETHYCIVPSSDSYKASEIILNLFSPSFRSNGNIASNINHKD